MACGKAVVASNLAGVRSVVEDGVNGFLTEPKNADDLASKINYLLTNPAVASGFGFRGREKAEQQYDWKIIGKQLEKIYKGLS
jgi:glycosyltransferase involved in cell wall biosynthesis